MITGRLVRSPLMTNTTPSKATSTKTTSKANGSSTGEHPDQPPVPEGTSTPSASSATPASAPAPDKKPVTVMIPEALHRKVKITAELSGQSLSDIVEEQLKIIVRERLPGLLAGLEAE